MKRYFVWLLIAALLLVLGACNAEKNAANSPQEGTTNQETAETGEKVYTIAYDFKCEASWFDRMQEGIAQFMEDTGHVVIPTAGTSDDAAEQVKDVQDLIAQGVDAIVIIPNDPASLEETLGEARKDGVVVVSHEAETLVETDFNLEGFTAEDYAVFRAEALAEAMGGEGQYVNFLGFLTNPNYVAWLDAQDAYLAENYPNIELVGDRYESEGVLENAYNNMKEVLRTYPNVKGMFGCDSFDLPGAARAVSEAGLSGQIALVGTGLPSQNVEYLADGTVNMVTFWDPKDVAYVLCEAAVRLLEGETFDKNSVSFDVPGYEECTSSDGIHYYGKAMAGATPENYEDYPF